jgi:carbonic anhydrase
MGVTMHHSRSAFLTGASALLLTAPAAAVQPELADNPKCPIVGADAAKELLDLGNKRFREPPMMHPHQTPQRRIDTGAKGQCPFAIVLTCADSRVPPDIVFDRGLGDLFVCRTAGNVIDPIVMGSMQYALEHYHPPILLVLGHQNCGAVEATLGYLRQPTPRPTVAPYIGAVVGAIVPAIKPTDSIEAAVKNNAIHVAAELGAKLMFERVKILTGYYSQSTGWVTYAPSWTAR